MQRIVKAYERYNEAIGAGRQLTLPLAEQPVAENWSANGNGNGNGEVKVVIPPAETAPQA